MDVRFRSVRTHGQFTISRAIPWHKYGLLRHVSNVWPEATAIGTRGGRGLVESRSFRRDVSRVELEGARAAG